MTKEEIQAMLARFGIENLKMVLLDNNRRVYVTKKMIDEGKAKFDDTLGSGTLIVKEQVGEDFDILCMDYIIIQTIIFNDPNPTSPL